MGVAGIDVGARRLDAVALDEQGRVTDVRAFGAAEVAAVVAWAEGATAIAIDSPDRWSTAPHAVDTALSPKFRTARCGEIGLGQIHGIWVPWTTPVTPAPDTWISVGIGLFAALRAAGQQPVEVYPHGVFRVLNHGRRPPAKRSPEGRQVRVGLLRAAGVSASWPDPVGHDVLDAAAAALVALDQAQGRATPATCGHDGSAIWLPPVRSGQHCRASATGVAEAPSAPLRRR